MNPIGDKFLGSRDPIPAHEHDIECSFPNDMMIIYRDAVSLESMMRSFDISRKKSYSCIHASSTTSLLSSPFWYTFAMSFMNSDVLIFSGVTAEVRSVIT
jgi:hypothetical protein